MGKKRVMASDRRKSFGGKGFLEFMLLARHGFDLVLFAIRGGSKFEADFSVWRDIELR